MIIETILLLVIIITSAILFKDTLNSITIINVNNAPIILAITFVLLVATSMYSLWQRDVEYLCKNTQNQTQKDQIK
jgi:predicted tellurium resistance membrane protein TerC